LDIRAEDTSLAWLIETANFAGLLLLLGAAAQRYLLAGVFADQSSTLRPPFLRRMLILMIIGLAVLIATSFFALQEPVFSAAQLMLAGLFFVAFYLNERVHARGLQVVALIAGLVLIGLQAISSHAADESGSLPIVSNAVHWLAAVAWGGGLLHFLLLPWSARSGNDGQHGEAMALAARRWATLSFIALALLAISGGLLAFTHIHNADAMNTSVYGAAFKFKAGLAALLLITLSLQRLKSVPACRDAASAEDLDFVLGRLRRLLGVESLLLAGLIVASGILATSKPPGLAPFLNPQTWNVAADDIPLTVEVQPVSGRLSQARLEISAATPEFRFAEGTRVVFSMTMPASGAGQSDVEALPIGPAAFLGEVVLAMPGDWRLDLALYRPGRDVSLAAYSVTLPGPPLEDDMRAYLNFSTISYSPANLITFFVGLLLIATATWSIRIALSNRAPLWMMPAGLVNIVLGGFLVLSVMFVKTYPSSFWTNPQPFTTEVVKHGDVLYRQHCADCHGLTGRGDGPWAIEDRGSIPDLSSPHMDSHTDGEMFWWIKYGIPSLDMPALGNELSTADNWAVINFIRSLRHEIPPP
jgi:putative copper export protein/mono/diheme cytochrome c family protein